MSSLIQKVIFKQIPEQASLKDYTHKTTACKFTLAGMTDKPTAMPRGINKLWQSSILAQRFGAHGLVMLPAGSPRPSQGSCTASNPAQGAARLHRAGMQHSSTAGSQVPPLTQPKPRQVRSNNSPSLPGIPLHDTEISAQPPMHRSMQLDSHHHTCFTEEEKSAWAF